MNTDHQIDIDKKLSLREFCKILGSNYKLVWKRLDLGYSILDATSLTGKQARSRGNSTHGLSKTHTYTTWESMHSRVKRDPRYIKNGIKVCERWNSYEMFLEDMGENPIGLSLDRYPDQKGNYEPGNCRWATAKEQSRNTSRNVKITAFEETKIIPEWSDLFGIPQEVIRKRLLRGWKPEIAITKKVQLRKI